MVFTLSVSGEKGHTQNIKHIHAILQIKLLFTEETDFTVRDEKKGKHVLS